MLHLFGFPCIKNGDQSLQGLPEKAYIMVALLLIEYRASVRRSILAGCLWENRTTDLANLNLRQLLTRIRLFEKQNSFEFIKTDYKELALVNSISCDLCKFLSIDKLTKPDELIDYVVSFGKEFLQGLGDNLGEDLSKWLLIQRQNYSNRFLQIALDGALHIGGSEGIKALEYLFSIHPYNEKVLQSLILLLSRGGKYKRAQRHFEEFAQKLNEDLQIAPKTSTIKLIARLFSEMTPHLQHKYSFLSATVANNELPSDDRNFHSEEKSKINDNPIPRLLLLPLGSGSNKSAISDYELANFVIEGMTLALCQTHNFVVLAPHTARQFIKLEHLQTQQILDVDYIISTHLMPDNAYLDKKEKRLLIKLTSVSSGEVLMMEEVLLTPDVFRKSYTDIVQSVINMIGLKIDRYVLSNFRNTGSADAYTFYLIGKERLSIGDLPNIRAARKTLKHALKLFPEFYLAQQMLARTYHLEWFLLGRPDHELLLKAKHMASNIIKKDPTIPGGHWEMGVAQLYLGDIEGARESTSLASSFAPYHADIIAHKADIFCHNGQHDEALKQVNLAMKLNPLPPDCYYWMQSCSKFFLGKYQEALGLISKVKLLVPSNLRLVAACHAMLGNGEEARNFKNDYLLEYPDFKIEYWEIMIPMSNHDDVSHYKTALYLAGFD